MSIAKHEWNEDAVCRHCGFDGAEFWHWKHNTYEGRASDMTQPECTVWREDTTSPTTPQSDDGDRDEDYDDNYDEDDLACTRCGGEGYADVDDPLWDECDEFGWGPCNACHGTGERKHQWVF